MIPASFRNDIQGLRALAVISVILFHYDTALLPGGFVGVDIFLVISGYLITQILLSRKAAEHYRLIPTLGGFYLSRIKRIVPAYYTMIVMVSVCAAVLFIESDFDIYAEGLRQALYFNSNSYFAGFGDYFAPATHEQPLLHSWSLAVEMQFYLFFPLLILLLPLKWAQWLLPVALIASLGVSEYMLRVESEEQSTYYALYARTPGFLVGAAIALFGIGKRWTPRQASGLWICGFLLILASVLLVSGPFPGLMVLPPILGAALMIAATNSNLSRCLTWAPLIWLGTLSYSLYLWHWPVLALIRYYSGEQNLNMIASLSFIILTLLLSLISYYCIESRFHGRRVNQKRVISLPRSVIFSLAALSVVAIACQQITKVVNEALSPPPLAIEYRRYADPATICHGKILYECLRGDSASNHEVLVIGDSHAAMLNHFFDLLGQELGFKARIITASSCITMPGFDYQRLPRWAQQPCVHQITEARKYIENTNMIFMAGMWSYQTQSEDFNKALEIFLGDMEQQDIQVYLLPQVVQFDKSPLRARRFQHLGLPDQVKQGTAWLEANIHLASIAQRYPNVTYLDLEKLDLFEEAPFYNNELIYFDEHHLNEVGAKLYVQMAREGVAASILSGQQ
ncbi:acyltransferase family protein [Zobellella sp. An-6]|uniref:acyltransferase family protein n=1 Tax=Zobellella sp. An-6 TaxID=3400218 RepID=UPI0040420293